MVTMEHNPNPLLSKAHITTLNLNNFKMIEAMGLKITASIPNFTKIYQAVQNLLVGTQTNSHFEMVEISFNVITTIQNFIQIHKSVQKLHPPQKFKRPSFWNG
jgi:hypothetical protein